MSYQTANPGWEDGYVGKVPISRQEDLSSYLHTHLTACALPAPREGNKKLSGACWLVQLNQQVIGSGRVKVSKLRQRVTEGLIGVGFWVHTRIPNVGREINISRCKSTIALEHKDKILIMCPNIGGIPERLKASRTKLITKSIAKI